MTDLISSEVDRFLAEKAQETAHRGRLIFALDATMSRQETWDMTCQLQAQMFSEVATTNGMDYAHAIMPYERSKLLDKVDIPSETCWPPGPRVRGTAFRGYKLAAFEAAARKHNVTAPDDAELKRARLRLITPPTSD
jgi:hypothetical protein